MPKAKNAKADEALALYRQGLQLVEIARRLDLPPGTVRRWKCTYKWDGGKSERSEPKKANARKRGGQPGNHNATGPPKNDHAVKHGLFRKWLPEDAVSIIEEMPKDPLDLLWDQIELAYAAILRAQRIMYVKDKDDKTVETVMEGYSDSGSTTAYNVQEAWDKQANFMKAQARAQSELRGLIKQYDEMLHKDWEAATAEQKARLDLLRSRISGGGDLVGKVVIINDTRDPDQ